MTTDFIDPQLKRNSLGLPELIFQGVTHIAPATNVVFTYPIIALKAGPDMPISFLLSTILCFFIGNTVAQFSKYMPSSGGYYSFATRGLGTHIGFMAAWSYLVYDLIGSAGSTGFLGYLLSDMLRTAFGWHIPWWVIAFATFAVIWTLTHNGVQLSIRVTALLGGLELLIMLSLCVTFLIHPGPGSSYLAPLIPSSSPHHFEGILAGMVFSILALSGFEGPAPLAQESRRASKLVGQAVILSLVAIGAFYVFTSYASAIGWGTGNMAAFAAHPNPYYALGHALWGAGWWFVVLALINSAVAVGLAGTNSASRVMYTMGRAGTLPAAFGRIHPVHRTPAFAIAFMQLFCIAAVLVVGLLLGPDYIFEILETIATLAVIVIYCLANVALTAYIRREHQDNFSVWHHLIFPWIATLAMLPVLFVTVYPVPAWPYNITPYVFVVSMILGFGYMLWLERREPGALSRGATMLVGSRTSEEGDVDWNKPLAPL
ncbi:MAG TPA: APC family permease [Acidobacteriaceae bacterium]|nr:APC family permease [Acidobacteriaceae bacterium]